MYWSLENENILERRDPSRAKWYRKSDKHICPALGKSTAFFGFVCFENVIKCQCLGERKEQDV